MAEDRDIIEQQDAVPVSEPVVETDNEVDAVCDEPSAVSGKYNRLFADSGPSSETKLSFSCSQIMPQSHAA